MDLISLTTDTENRVELVCVHQELILKFIRITSNNKFKTNGTVVLHEW